MLRQQLCVAKRLSSPGLCITRSYSSAEVLLGQAFFLASSADAAAAGAGAGVVPKPTLRQLEWTEMEIAAL